MSPYSKDKIYSLACVLRDLLSGPVRVMEVCGTHTVNIFRFGLRTLFPEGLELLSGPGCPVCVTPVREIDFLVAASGLKGTVVATFGDLLRVPGSEGSLKEARARGGEVKIIYSPMEALDLAEQFPEKKIVLAAVGFETTAPAVAATIIEARKRGLKNFLVASSHRLVPPALKALLSSGKIKIDGFLLPGHVSAIIGRRPYEFIARDFGLPAVITGFEALDIMEGLWLVLRQIHLGQVGVEIQYRRAVPVEGNPAALRLLEEVFEKAPALWRGLGELEDSGLRLRPAYKDYDAWIQLDVALPQSQEPKGCLCGEILCGRKKPPDCPLFGRGCRPEKPQGPCMVSSEGTCAAWFQYV
ncbi:hydrogenase formation protein HypD [Thermosulfuriphilus sp.]